MQVSGIRDIVCKPRERGSDSPRGVTPQVEKCCTKDLFHEGSMLSFPPPGPHRLSPPFPLVQ